MPIWFPFPIIASFVLTALFVPAVIAVAKRFGILDKPTGGRKIHTLPTPLMGGLALFLGFLIPVIVVLLASNHLTSGQIGLRHYFGFALAGTVLMVGGILDDKFNLSPKKSIWFPVLAALIASLAGIGVSKITNPFGGAIFVMPIVSGVMTFVWLLVMSYATKLLDGVDGLAASVGTTASLAITALALSKMYFQPDVALLSMMFAASLLGFLLWNFPRARIFLGEGGSTFLGFTLGTLAIISGSKMITLLLVLGIPCLDIIHVAYRRYSEGRSITSGDRYHFHHLLFDAGLSERQVVAVYALFTIPFGSATLFFSHAYKLFILLGLSILFLVVASFLYHKHNVVIPT
ncbi:MAG: MraY family glycosyltransferase [Patescibacteria group bacterium]|jgi:UDP-GlcNAc:undecaprenyl-phosphate GlcNAc-1-phosphate transferase